MSLTEFLLARIAEDEAVARGAGHEGSRWTTPDGYGSGAVEAVDCPPREVGIVVYDEGRPSEQQATHIARHDPARVLAECEAKRRIVEDYAVLEADYRLTRSPETEARRFQALVSVGQLAIVYADHPDYREEWRP